MRDQEVNIDIEDDMELVPKINPALLKAKEPTANAFTTEREVENSVNSEEMEMCGSSKDRDYASINRRISRSKSKSKSKVRNHRSRSRARSFNRSISRTFTPNTSINIVLNDDDVTPSKSWLEKTTNKFTEKIDQLAVNTTFENQQIAKLLGGNNSIFFKVDDNLVSIRNEKYLISCFQCDEKWKTDPNPLYNIRFLEVYFANNLKWKSIIIKLMILKEILSIIIYIIDEYEGYWYILKIIQLLIFIYVYKIFLKNVNNEYQQLQTTIAFQQQTTLNTSENSTTDGSSYLFDDYFESQNKKKILNTVESKLAFNRACFIFHIICLIMMFDSLPFISNKSNIQYFWVYMIPNTIFIFNEMWVHINYIFYWIIIYLIFLPFITIIGLLNRNLLTSNITSSLWFIIVITFVILCISLASYVSAKHKLSLANQDLHLRHQLFVERREHKKIMTSLMPENIAELILLKGVTPQYNKCVTVGFVKMSFYDPYHQKLTDPLLLIPLLHKCIIALDKEIKNWEPHIVKIEHVENCYLICGGILNQNEDFRHAEGVIRCCLAFTQKINSLNQSFGTHITCQLSIGINTGHVIGTIIGSYRKYFRIFGDTVNTASRVCTTGVKGKICISENTYKQKAVNQVFELKQREPVFMKGKGMKITYLVENLLQFKQYSNPSRTTSKVRKNKDWRWKYCGQDNAMDFGMDLLSMHFYQFLNTEDSNASIITLQFPIINNNNNNNNNNDKSLVVMKQSVRSFLSARKNNMNNEEKTESLEYIFTENMNNWNLNNFLYFTIYLTMVIILSGSISFVVINILSIIGLILIILHFICLLILICGIIIYINKYEKNKKFGKYLQKLQQLLYTNLALIFLIQTFRNYEKGSQVYKNREFYDATFILLFCLGIVAGFFVFGFKYFGITMWSFFILFLHSIFQAINQQTAFTAILIEYYIFFICATLKYQNEKAWRKNIIYNEGIKKSRDERQESTSILIPQVIVGQVIKQSLTSSNKLLSRKFKSATIFQSDIVGFTKLSSQLNASQVVALLHNLYEIYDKFTIQCQCEKIETIGDAYICVNFTKGSSEKVIQFALNVIDAHQQMQQYQIKPLMDDNINKNYFELLSKNLNYNDSPIIDVNVRCGIATGNVTGCVLGLSGLRFHLFGEALERAIQLEGISQTNRVLVCSKTKQHCHDKFIKFEKCNDNNIDAYYVVDTSRKVLNDLSEFMKQERSEMVSNIIGTTTTNDRTAQNSAYLDHTTNNVHTFKRSKSLNLNVPLRQRNISYNSSSSKKSFISRILGRDNGGDIQQQNESSISNEQLQSMVRKKTLSNMSFVSNSSTIVEEETKISSD